ncbi:hypothetical protein [Nocardia sp. NPDC048505]|uniref:hypothetical protein n=1 Tax=unclassified Nocardia TaxID=2637762 RepID=UPI00340173BF
MVMHDEQDGRAGLGRMAWTDQGQIRAHLEAGADPDARYFTSEGSIKQLDWTVTASIALGLPSSGVSDREHTKAHRFTGRVDICLRRDRTCHRLVLGVTK